jgi:tetratricopeptide (TPR) repeat protein
MAAARDGSYRKERFIRVPTHLRWGGRTHEALAGAGWNERELIPNCRFWEAPKSPAQYQHKVERDLQILLEETAEQPFNARWWYYLGQTYEGLKRPREAVEAFTKCVRLDGWADECGWACYTAARCLVSLGEFREAEELCALGLTRKPSCPELTWLAGWSCFQRGALAESIVWCKMTLAQQGNGGFIEATGFRHVPAWFEAPYDVLRFAHRQLGKTAEAEQYEKEFAAAKAARQREFPNA